MGFKGNTALSWRHGAATYFLPGFLSLKRDVRVSQFKMARPKIWQRFFFNILPKTRLWKVFVLASLVLFQRNRMWTLKNIVSEMEWTWVAGSTLDFSETEDNSHKPSYIFS